MRDRDQVRLIIEGQEVSGFDPVEIGMSIDQIADVFTLTAPFDPDDALQRRLFRPFGYQPVQVYAGDDVVLSGRNDKVTPGLGNDGRNVTLEGRSKTGVLCDCSIDGDGEHSGLSLSAVASKLSGPFSVFIRADADSEAIPETRNEYGQRVGDFLQSIATPRGFLLNSSFDGKLVISSGAALAGKSPVADLEEGRAPLLSVSASFDSSQRFSIHKIASQFAGEYGIGGSVNDSGVPIRRPNIAAVGESAQDPTVTAARLRAESIAKAIGVNALVSGWRRPDGALWSERQVVTLRAPSAMIYKKTAFLVQACRLSLSKDTQSTTLTLVPQDLYATREIKEPEWE